MRNRSLFTALLACALLLPAAAMAGAELNVVKALQLSGSEKAAQLTIAGTRAPTFTVFKMQSPARVVVDLAGADVSAVRGEKAGRGPIGPVNVSQHSDERATVGRVVVAIAEDARYEVKAVGDDVVISVGAEEKGASAAAAPEAERLAAAEPAAAATPAPQAPAAAAPTEDIVSTRRDERALAHPAKRLNAVKFASKAGALEVQLLADAEVGTFEVVELAHPPRLALDLLGFEKALKTSRPAPGTALKEVRFGKHEDKVRAVLDLSGAEAMPEYRVERMSAGLRVSLATGPAAVAKAEAKPAAEVKKAEPPAAKVATEVAAVAVQPEPKAEPAKAEAKKPAHLASVRDVTFRGDQSRGRVVIAVTKGVEYQVSRPDPRTAVLTLRGANLPKRLERSLDTSAFGGPVKMVSSFSAPGQLDQVQVVATLDGSAQDRIAFEGNGQLAWEFVSEAPARAEAAEMLLDGRRVELQEEASSAPKTGAFAAESNAYASSAAGRRARYVGRRVSFEFKDIDIHNLLRIIAEVSKKNIVVADNVSGKVTIKLRNVPWDQALDLILKSKGLDKDESGNIIRVAPLKELEEERKIVAQAEQDAMERAPLKVRLIPVNYAVAGTIAEKVKDLLTKRGTMNVDQRTNVIIVKDTVEALARAEGLVRRLDTQTPQVLIEGRIVEANSNFDRAFGIQWGGNISMSPATGNPTGLLFPSIVRMAGASSPEGTQGTADTPNYAVNLPAPIGAGVGGGVGFIFGSAGGAVALNLRLTAMENNGQIKTVSAPKITTLDNTSATISQGVSIPFSQTSASGVNTSFIEAKLQLTVTPHVTADGSVLLQIAATNNQPNPGITGSNGQPSITKKEANTQVLVKDGDTTVIGGIYTRSQALSEAAVPVLSKIPVLGWLFKKRSETDSRTELLVFITPRIVNRSQTVAAGDANNQ